MICNSILWLNHRNKYYYFHFGLYYLRTWLDIVALQHVGINIFNLLILYFFGVPVSFAATKKGKAALAAGMNIRYRYDVN